VPIHYLQGSAREQGVLDMLVKLMRAQGSVMTHLNAVARRYDLSPGQFAALEVLQHVGPLCQKELGARLFSTEGNVTQIVDNLEKRELVQRVRNPDDRRYITVHLTPGGRRLIRKVFPVYLKELLEISGSFTDREVSDLAALCKKLGLAAAPG
jgi:MarR family 2-MHQ and catechol resistance regulon transcriptional repressor